MMPAPTARQLFLIGYAFLSINNGDNGCRSASAFSPKIQCHRSRKLVDSTRLLLSMRNKDEKSAEEKSEADMSEDLLEKRLHLDLNAMVEDESNLLGFTPSNFDNSQIPIPVFTAVLILLGSLYVTGYGFYVGINGFPVDSGLPPIF
jgi:hypothetical protein